MKKLFALLLFTIFFGLKSFACGNAFYTYSKDGKVITPGYRWAFYKFNMNFNPELNVTKLKKLEARLKKEKNYMLLSDYALCLLKLGKAKEAVAVFAELYKHYPNDYKIAANLGTAYEVNGQVDSAMKYIRRDMQLNPNDHEGSEWIHVKVLETKLALQKDPSYLNNHSVLQLTEQQKKDSNVFNQLFIQLEERFPFSPGPNAIMVSLFTDLGDITANIKSVEHARAYYLMAEKYFGGKSPELDKKIKDMEKLINKYEAGQPANPPKSPETGMPANSFGYVSYLQFLDDNTDKHYILNWSKINTNTNSLLAMVDFTMTEEQAKKTTGKQNDGLKLIPEHN
ncbi:MAG TPA: tetratricopeptide repeat protein [Bacteroidia bacterium]|nr:tetratricopeptide repeat protein [Bacteroidia bacterium]